MIVNFVIHTTRDLKKIRRKITCTRKKKSRFTLSVVLDNYKMIFELILPMLFSKRGGPTFEALRRVCAAVLGAGSKFKSRPGFPYKKGALEIEL